MPDPTLLRDSTQIVLPLATIGDLESQLDDEFAVTIVPERDEHRRIIGSPVEIKQVSRFLARQGVSVP